MPKLYCGDIDIPGFHPRDLTESSMHRPNNREATAKSRTCNCVHDAGGSGVNRQWLNNFIYHTFYSFSRAKSYNRLLMKNSRRRDFIEISRIDMWKLRYDYDTIHDIS